MKTTQNDVAERGGWREWKWLSAAEFAVGAMVVIAHNVYRVLPNEVPILAVVGIISLRLRNGGLGAIGLRRPSSWKWTVLIAVAAAALRITLGELVVVPLASRVFPSPVESQVIGTLAGNVKQALLMLAFVWTFAAFGEEFVYRGYLLRRAAEIGRCSQKAYWVALIAVSVLFGIGHYYKGPSGVIDSTMAGLILGGAYILCKRNLWVPILAHGFIDTFAVVVVYLGWAS